MYQPLTLESYNTLLTTLAGALSDWIHFFLHEGSLKFTHGRFRFTALEIFGLVERSKITRLFLKGKEVGFETPLFFSNIHTSSKNT